VIGRGPRRREAHGQRMAKLRANAQRRPRAGEASRCTVWTVLEGSVGIPCGQSNKRTVGEKGLSDLSASYVGIAVQTVQIPQEGPAQRRRFGRFGRFWPHKSVLTSTSFHADSLKGEPGPERFSSPLFEKTVQTGQGCAPGKVGTIIETHKIALTQHAACDLRSFDLPAAVSES
jgi:hypothetical protein